jgi:UPF0755 protein
MTREKKVPVAFVVVLLIFYWFWFGLRPVSGNTDPKIFEIKKGQGFREIVQSLRGGGLIRSSAAFEIYAVLTGAARHLKPGLYEFAESSSTPQIISLLAHGPREVSVRIPDGASIREVDAILASLNILPAGALLTFAKDQKLEGHLYPDTYSFMEHSIPEDVVAAFLKNFDAKAAPILNKEKNNFEQNLILASLIQKEVSDQKDARIVAGILKKRLVAGVALNVDATICYIKKEKGIPNCYPLVPADFKIDSAYNTYLYKGLPPGPMLNPISSPYWFYLSDPKTGKTIFAKTLEEQNANRSRYLR